MTNLVVDDKNEDGVRSPYTIFPMKSTDPVPLSILYTPLTQCEYVTVSPIYCSSCKSLMNSFTKTKNNFWQCIFCFHSNQITTPLVPLKSSVKYKLQKTKAPSIYCFLIDICTFDDERHNLMVDAVYCAFEMLPPDAYVCFVLVGTNVTIVQKNKNFLFSGKKLYTRAFFHETFGSNMKYSLVTKFFKKKSEINIDQLNLRRDPFPVPTGHRPLRSIGSALSLVHSILDAEYGKVLFFLQGPCTYGEGAICSLLLKESLRSHSDITNGLDRKPGYYSKVAKMFASQGNSVDIFATTLEDVGVYEMRDLATLTGGVIVMAQDFKRETYISSIIKHFDQFTPGCDYGHAINVKIKIITSQNLKFIKSLGLGTFQSNIVSLNSCPYSTNLTFIFDPINAKTDDVAYVQIITQFQDNEGVWIKSTTISKTFSDDRSKIANGIDQEAACIVQTRENIHLNQFEDDLDLIKRLDRGMIKFIKTYGDFIKDDVNSLTLPKSITLYPNFIYFLRRSSIVRSETMSPDETTYYRNIICRASVSDAMALIKPTIRSYHYIQGVRPTILDARSLKDDVILLLDCYSHIILWRGEHIQKWMEKKLHEQKEYASLAKVIKDSEAKAIEMVDMRMPTPVFVNTQKGDSQERFLTSMVNPKKSVETKQNTDDIDIDEFLSFLKRVVVQS